MAILFDGIYANGNIQQIEIIKNDIKSTAIKQLIQLFEKGRRQVKIFKLTNTKSSTEDFEILCEALSEYPSLIELKLNGFTISE